MCAYEQHLVSIIPTCGNRDKLQPTEPLHLCVLFRTAVVSHMCFRLSPAALASSTHRLTYQPKRSRLSRLFSNVWHLAHPEPRLKGQLLVVAPNRCPPPSNHHGRVAFRVQQLLGQSALFSASVRRRQLSLLNPSFARTDRSRSWLDAISRKPTPTHHSLPRNKQTFLTRYIHEPPGTDYNNITPASARWSRLHTSSIAARRYSRMDGGGMHP